MAQARAAALQARVQRDARRKAGGGGAGGGVGANGAADVSQYLIDNPGDLPGARRLAAQRGVASKEFDKIVTQTKGTEGQNKNAHQAKVGERALDEIAARGFKPNKAEIQKWLNNSRLVHLADKDGVVGGLASVGQTLGAVPQSEVDGLSPEAAAYFGNVRRYMETIGRAQSGAAISPSEWTNFFNQYGPNSKGGTDAARQYLRDQAKLSGVAGRQLDAGDKKPASSPAGSAGTDAEAIGWAKAHLSDPRARAILKANGL